MSSNLDRYERIAPLYDLLDLPFEYSRYRKILPLLFQGLKGRVLDAGIGTGRNIQFYPPGAQVVGIDISPAMLARAERRRLSLGARVELHQMDVTHLAFEDQSFDAAVTLYFATDATSQKAGNIKLNNKVSVAIDSERQNF